MDLTTIGKNIIFISIFVFLFGVIIFFAGKSNIPIGKLPGDIFINSENTTFYFPIVSCLILSLVITLAVNLFGKR